MLRLFTTCTNVVLCLFHLVSAKCNALKQDIQRIYLLFVVNACFVCIALCSSILLCPNYPWIFFYSGSGDHVIRYLGQYMHRIAISNRNITNITDTHVEFIAKDFQDKAKKKPKKLTGYEFLRRFCQHIMPEHFVKIRYFGIYNATTKRNLELQFELPTIDSIEKRKTIQNETAVDCLKRVIGIDITLCPICKNGTMHRIKEIPKIRSPAKSVITLLLSFLV